MSAGEGVGENSVGRKGEGVYRKNWYGLNCGGNKKNIISRSYVFNLLKPESEEIFHLWSCFL